MFKKKENYHQKDKSQSLTLKPLIENPSYLTANKLGGKKAIITGEDSGIGAAFAIAFAHEEADIGIVYHENDEDALIVKERIIELGRSAYLYKGDIGHEDVVKNAVDFFTKKFGSIDILVNNAAEQYERNSIVDIDTEEIDREFSTNIYSFMYFTKHLFPYFNKGIKGHLSKITLQLMRTEVIQNY